MMETLLYADTWVVTSPDADLAKESTKLTLADRVLPQEADIRRKVPAPDKIIALQPDTHLCGSVP
jgi:hypothetical protein